MLEILNYFEQAILRLNTPTLISTAIACVLVGLFVWLGGLGFRKPLIIITAAIAAGAYGFFITNRNIILIAACVAAAVVIALVLEKIFVIVMAVALTIALGFGIMAGPYFGKVESFRQLCSQMPTYSWLIILAMAIALLVIGFFFWHLASALYCSTLGIILIFAGMFMLLSFKGSEPITYISRNPSLYITISGIMIAFGTIEQLMLCRSAKNKTEAKKQKNEEKEQVKEKPSNWRAK